MANRAMPPFLLHAVAYDPCQKEKHLALPEKAKINHFFREIWELLTHKAQDLALFASRFFICFCTSLLPPLLPALMERSRLSILEASSLVSILGVSSSLMQPVFGYLEDRVGYKKFLVFGPLWVALFISGLSLSRNYIGLATFLILAGSGMGAFHPASFTHAGTEKECSGIHALSLLLFAGTLGFVAGPMAVTLLITHGGLQSLSVILVPGALLSFALWNNVGCRKHKPAHQATQGLEGLRQTVSATYPFFCFALGITIVSMNCYTFFPIALREDGAAFSVMGLLLTVFALGSAIGPLLGSFVSRKTGNDQVMLVSMVGSSLLLAACLYCSATWTKMLLGFLLGLCLMSPFSIIIYLAQALSPQSLGVVSSILGGVVWGIGALTVSPIGWLAEAVGLRPILYCLCLVPLLALGLFFSCRTTSDRKL